MTEECSEKQVDARNSLPIIAIVREDRSRRKDAKPPFLRLKAEDTELTISGGGCVTATFPATVYQPGVLADYLQVRLGVLNSGQLYIAVETKNSLCSL